MLHINSDGPETKIGPTDAPKFQNVVLVGLTVGSICTVIFHFFVKEENGYTGNNVRGGQLRLTVRELLCNIQIYQVQPFDSIKSKVYQM